ncbi:reverse transcriptase domain-containing protein [Tanacetum coccineum]|uniref:Reverse transcriptase domain-containing protein n=1 Tax=Tanacetum coccineum TaxID=301880 RepID=A0ABQ5HHE3_9ASTR
MIALANRVEVAEFRMLKWTCGKTLLDMIPNGAYRSQLEVETIINKMRERWLRRGRPKLRWEDKVKHDIKELLLSEDMTCDRNEWRARIRLGCSCCLRYASVRWARYVKRLFGLKGVERWTKTIPSGIAILTALAEKVHKEKAQLDKLKEVKARLNFEGTSDVRGDLRRRLRSRRFRSMSRSLEPTPSVFSRIRRDRSESPRNRLGDKGRKEGGVFKRLEVQEEVRPHTQRVATKVPSEDKGGGHWKSRSKNKSRALKKKTCLSHSEDPEDHLKIFQAVEKVERWEMPTWCHMFNSTLTGSARVWFDDLPPESVDSYDDLKKAFLANFLQQKKCINDPVEIHHIKQREGKSTEDFVQRFKTESRHVKGAPECMRITGFMHGITNPELIKRLHENILKSLDDMMRVTTVFLGGEVATSNQTRKKTLPAWKQQEAG